MSVSPTRLANMVLVASIGTLVVSGAVRADIILSSNDAHTVLSPEMKAVAPNPVGPDTVTLIDVSHYPPTIKATIDAPGSVVGPPGAAWISKDESWGIVTSASKADSQVKPSGIGPDDRVSVLDLSSSPPKVVQSLTAGSGATQVRVSPNGELALIANRAEGTVSVFTVKDKRLTPVGKVDTGNAKSLPSAVVFVDDETALLTRSGDNMVSVLHIKGTDVTIDPRPITTGVSPYTMDINAAHTLAAVSNMGRGDGDEDSVSLIDLKSHPYRTVGTFGVASGPEPLRFSPNGEFLAVGAQMGTTKPTSNPFYHAKGQVAIFAVEGHTLRHVATAPAGPWAEAVAWSRDGKTVLQQSMKDRNIDVFRWDGHKLTPGTPLEIKGAGPATFATPWP